jgi:hypothetical protein
LENLGRRLLSKYAQAGLAGALRADPGLGSSAGSGLEHPKTRVVLKFPVRALSRFKKKRITVGRQPFRVMKGWSDCNGGAGWKHSRAAGPAHFGRGLNNYETSPKAEASLNLIPAHNQCLLPEMQTKANPFASHGAEFQELDTRA